MTSHEKSKEQSNEEPIIKWQQIKKSQKEKRKRNKDRMIRRHKLEKKNKRKIGKKEI